MKGTLIFVVGAVVGWIARRIYTSFCIENCQPGAEFNSSNNAGTSSRSPDDNGSAQMDKNRDITKNDSDESDESGLKSKSTKTIKQQPGSQTDDVINTSVTSQDTETSNLSEKTDPIAHYSESAEQNDSSTEDMAPDHTEAASLVAENESGIVSVSSHMDNSPALNTSAPESNGLGESGDQVTDVDDLTIIKGIGPKIAKSFHAIGITKFNHLADLSKDSVIEKLELAGIRIVNKELLRSFPEQAAFAVKEDWDGLEALKKDL